MKERRDFVSRVWTKRLFKNTFTLNLFTLVTLCDTNYGQNISMKLILLDSFDSSERGVKDE